MGRIRDGARRLATLHGSPRGIAGGFAMGLGLSLFPVPTAGMITALALAPVLRCNLPATYLGSAVVNPVTGPFIYFAELWLGLWLTGHPVPTYDELGALDAAGWLSLMRTMAGPFLLGALVLLATAAVISFLVIYPLARRWQAHLAADPNHDEGDARGARTSPVESSSD